MRKLLRPGTIYGVSVVDIPWAYVGKTRHRDYRRRVARHLHGYRGSPPQPWADIYVRDFVLWSSPRVSTLGLAVREWYYIRRPLGPASARPAFNIRMNEANPHRIPPWIAKQQCQERESVLRSSKRSRSSNSKQTSGLFPFPNARRP
jgi:hypothetical protein